MADSLPFDTKILTLQNHFIANKIKNLVRSREQKPLSQDEFNAANAALMFTLDLGVEKQMKSKSVILHHASNGCIFIDA